jgi:predicted transcriptional regulator
MKTAVSIPDDVFQGAERLARRSRKSRSELYADAVREYVARHGAAEVTEAYDALARDLGQQHLDQSAFARKAAARTLSRSEW